MSINKDYAQQFKEMGYKRKVIAFKLSNEIPENAEDYGEDMSFLCAISAEPWEEGRKPFYITSKNSLCGGPLYAGIGNRKIDKEEFDGGMSQTLGEQEATNQEISLEGQPAGIAHIPPSQISPIIGCWRISKNLIL